MHLRLKGRRVPFEYVPQRARRTANQLLYIVADVRKASLHQRLLETDHFLAGPRDRPVADDFPRDAQGVKKRVFLVLAAGDVVHRTTTELGDLAVAQQLGPGQVVDLALMTVPGQHRHRAGYAFLAHRCGSSIARCATL